MGRVSPKCLFQNSVISSVYLFQNKEKSLTWCWTIKLIRSIQTVNSTIAFLGKKYAGSVPAFKFTVRTSWS